MVIVAFSPNHFSAATETKISQLGLQLGFTRSAKNDYSQNVLVGGKTFPIKDQLKAAGARWNGTAKAWEFKSETDLETAVASLEVL